MSVLVWKQPAAGNKLLRARQSATRVVEALLVRACSEKMATPSKSFFGDILLPSSDCLLSIAQIDCPERMKVSLRESAGLLTRSTCPQSPPSSSEAAA
ncbi:hypothetical protein [Bradyrhizobium sp. STM 3561]|uniref:hypothetical protein n=1 Tax=Bradyrhizobium sp. STM 3561 TaxID=578923 RepID=UPI00388D0EB9